MDDVFQRFLRKSGPVLCLDIGSGTQDALLARAGAAVENWSASTITKKELHR